MAEGEESSNKFEDLFDDLDKFFAPIEGVDHLHSENPSAEEGGTSDPEGSAGSEPPGSVSPEGPDERSAPPAVDGGDPHREWRRLRDVLGDEQAGEEAEEGGEEFDFLTGSEVEAEPEGTLLAPAAEEEAGPETRHMEPEPPAEPPAEGPPEPAAVPPEEPAFPTEGGQWEEPAIAEVEAAADRLAEQFRGEEAPGEDEVIPGGGVEEELLDLGGEAPPIRPPMDEPPRPGPRTIKVGEPERMMGGPTWEEPTGSHPLIAEPAPPRGGRDLPMALITGVGLAVVALIAAFFSKAAFAVVASIVVLIALAELYATMHRRGYQPATALGLVVGALVLAGGYLKGEQAMLFFVALGMLLSFLWYMAGPVKGREHAVANVGSTVLGVMYVPLLAGYILVILSQPVGGLALMLSVLALTFLYDVAAFAIGSLWGARPLAPSISPKKSWEGLVGATIVTFVVAVAILAQIDPLSVSRAIGLWLVVAVFAPLGDLAESAIKRDLQVKDMGSILPGHGGALDRIDSVLFVAPAALYFFRLIF